MKIGEVVVGTQYGAVDQLRGYDRGTPRQVEVLNIKTVEEEVWSSAGFTSHRSTRKVRRVEVKFLDDPQFYWHSDKIKSAKKGSKLVIEARQIVGAWSELYPAIREKAEREQREREVHAAMLKRVKALGIGKEGYGNWRLTTLRNVLELAVYSGSLEKLMKLAELGKDIGEPR